MSKIISIVGFLFLLVNFLTVPVSAQSCIPYPRSCPDPNYDSGCCSPYSCLDGYCTGTTTPITLPPVPSCVSGIGTSCNASTLCCAPNTCVEGTCQNPADLIANCVPDPPNGSCSALRPCCNYPGRDRRCEEVTGYCRDVIVPFPVPAPVPIDLICDEAKVRACQAQGKVCQKGVCEKITSATAGGIPCGDDPKDPGFKTAIGCIHTSPVALVKDFLKFGLGIGGGLAFLIMLLGAFQMLTSAGNPETLATGKDRLTSAVIGLLFVIFSVLLLQIIGVGILDIPGFGR